MRPSRSETAQPASRIECSTSEPRDLAALADRGVGADVAVAQPRAGADDRRAAHGRALQPRARLDHHAPVHLRVDQLAVDPLGQVVEDQAVGLEHVLQAPGVLPPAAHDVRLDAHAAVDQVLDRVGDLELAARRRLDRARRVVDLRREHVHADERQVGRRLASASRPGARPGPSRRARRRRSSATP